jgi:hypothetical protein
VAGVAVGVGVTGVGVIVTGDGIVDVVVALGVLAGVDAFVLVSAAAEWSITIPLDAPMATTINMTATSKDAKAAARMA